MTAALGLFFIGGLLTTVVPPLLDKSWSKPFANSDPAKGPTGKLVGYTDQEMRGYGIYIREGCKYCHTQQTRTLLARYHALRLEGRPAPVSTPDEFVYDWRQTFGTKRTGPGSFAHRRQVRQAWHKAHFNNPRDLVPGSIMPPFPWIANNPQELGRPGGLPADAGPRQGLAAGQRLREVRLTMSDYTYPSVYFANLLFVLLAGGAVYFFFRSVKDGYWGRNSEEPSTACSGTTDEINQPIGAEAPRRT